MCFLESKLRFSFFTCVVIIYIYVFNEQTIFIYIIIQMKRDELDKKIVEVAPDDHFKTEIFPQFVPKNMRYKCSIPLCNYTGMTEEMLKSHISILHSTYQCYM
jgi:hypothetical protein